MMEEFVPDKALMLDTSGRPITQSMFLEVGYSDAAIYTLKDQDHDYKGKVYPSLKRLYLEEEDPTEYSFVTKYLLNWRQWQRLYDNKLLRPHIEDWREELELKLRSRATKEMIKKAEKGNIQASKWLADRGWANRGAGRPSKEEVQNEKRFQARVDKDYTADIIRLNTGT
jgi:hypothetical protein